MDKAREIGADEDESAADDLMGRLARKEPEPKKARDAKNASQKRSVNSVTK